jgi:O-6-methylguanine DNA methyltransferase
MENVGGWTVIYYTFMESPIGDLLLTSDGEALTGLYMSVPELDSRHGTSIQPNEEGYDFDSKPAKMPALRSSTPSSIHTSQEFCGFKKFDQKELHQQDDNAYPFATLKQQLKEYFAGERVDFDVPLRLIGTDFQRKVWTELRKIPYGTTISYGELARRIGNPNAVRAAGLANGRNPISIIVACHRVIGADGSLTGYGGGLPRKEALLKLESKQLKVPVISAR